MVYFGTWSQLMLHKWYIMGSSHKFWWNQLIPHMYTNYYVMANEMVIDQVILFYKPNKNF